MDPADDEESGETALATLAKVSVLEGHADALSESAANVKAVFAC